MSLFGKIDTGMIPVAQDGYVPLYACMYVCVCVYVCMTTYVSICVHACAYSAKWYNG